MHHSFLVFSFLMLLSCQKDESLKQSCRELYIETGDKKYLDLSDCSDELAQFKQKQKEVSQQVLQKIDEEQKREQTKKKVEDQKLSDLPSLKKRLLISEFKEKLCKMLIPRLESNKTELDTANYNLSISNLESVGTVYTLAAEWPEGAADIQSIWYKKDGTEFCTDGGFTGGTCVDIFPKYNRLEIFSFNGSPKQVFEELECERSL